MPRDDLILVRQGTTASWDAVDPILDDGELVWDKTVRRLKVGTGAVWSATPYATDTVGSGGGGGGGELPEGEHRMQVVGQFPYQPSGDVGDVVAYVQPGLIRFYVVGDELDQSGSLDADTGTSYPWMVSADQGVTYEGTPGEDNRSVVVPVAVDGAALTYAKKLGDFGSIEHTVGLRCFISADPGFDTTRITIAAALRISGASVYFGTDDPVLYLLPVTTAWSPTVTSQQSGQYVLLESPTGAVMQATANEVKASVESAFEGSSAELEGVYIATTTGAAQFEVTVYGSYDTASRRKTTSRLFTPDDGVIAAVAQLQQQVAALQGGDVA